MFQKLLIISCLLTAVYSLVQISTFKKELKRIDENQKLFHEDVIDWTTNHRFRIENLETKVNVK